MSSACYEEAGISLLCGGCLNSLLVQGDASCCKCRKLIRYSVLWMAASCPCPVCSERAN